MDEEVRYRPLPLRQRMLIGLLAVATATTLIMMMLERAGAPDIPRPPAAPGAAPCAAGQVSGCLGGKVDVIAVPAAAAAASGGRRGQHLPRLPAAEQRRRRRRRSGRGQPLGLFGRWQAALASRAR